jgi:uncharacterized protein (DUF488 family)
MEDDLVQITVRTIGYEGTQVDDFVALLRAKDVTCLVDVREIASSRRKGFSKSQLKARLQLAGIDYLHLRSLGDPKEGRIAARGGNFRLFDRIYRRHLKTSEAQEALASVIMKAKENSICLMCFERDPQTCHRNIVVEEMCKTGQFAVEHLGVPEDFAIQGHGPTAKRRPAWSGESSYPG